MRKLTQLLICLTLPLLVLNCDQSYQFKHSHVDCSFWFSYSEGQQCGEQFSFQDCKWNECVTASTFVLPYFGGSGGKTSQTCTGRHSTDWNFCTRLCCDDEVIYSMDYQSIKDCQHYLWYLDIWIITGIFGSLIVLYMLYWCICGAVKGIRSLDQRIRRRQELLEAQNWRNRHQWQPAQYINPRIQQPCTICLDQDPRCEIVSCKHTFHVRCLLAALRRRRKCPLCRQDKVQDVIVYCEQCCEYSRLRNLQMDRGQLYTKQICIRCSKSDPSA